MLVVNFPKICVLAGLAVAGGAQLAAPSRGIPLYPGVAPGSENWKYPGEICRHGGQAASAEYRSAGIAQLSG
jgi:hypothetical protein